MLYVSFYNKYFFTDNRFVKLFAKFDLIVKSCFGQTLDINYVHHINDFFECLDEENISLINKLHVLLFHVKEFISFHKASLGFFSEQAVEAVHFDYNKYKIRYADNASGKNKNNALLRSIRAYNADHL